LGSNSPKGWILRPAPAARITDEIVSGFGSPTRKLGLYLVHV